MIQFENVSFNYENGEKILNDINLTIHEGEVICLTGASGCGKTTMTRLLNGTIPHFFHGDIEGRILVNHKNITKQSIYEISQASGSVFQNPRSQFFCLNTTSELAFEPENYGVDPITIKSHIANSADEFNIKHLLDRGIFNLSGGEKQLIACTTIQVSGHDIIILDEPSSNLDFKTIIKLRKMLKIWKREGKTIMIAEHRLHYLIDVVDCFIIMDQGRISNSYDQATFEKLSHDTLATLGLRTTHLEKMKPKRHSNSTWGTLTLRDFKFKYKNSLPLSINIPKVELSKGKVTAVIGHNGSGKSTFARCLTGVERKFKGTVDNDDITLKRGHRLNNVYLVFQDVNNQLFAESVDEELRLSNVELDNETIQERLQYYGISQHVERHPLSLSGGEKQRLAIASAVETNRDILIFDEPSSGLDGQRMREMSGIIDSLANKGHTIIVITHDYELLLSCADDILHLEHGHVKDQYTLNDENLAKLQAFFEI